MEFNVPCTSLKDRVSGKVSDGCSMGPKHYLTSEEENKLVSLLLNVRRWGMVRQDKT